MALQAGSGNARSATGRIESVVAANEDSAEKVPTSSRRAAPGATTAFYKRIQLILTERSYARLEETKAMTEAHSIAEVARAALRFYSAMVAEAAKGKEIFLESPDNPGVREKIRLL